MKRVEKHNNIAQALIRAFPSSHMIAIGALTLVLALVSLMSGQNAAASRQTTTLTLPSLVDEIQSPEASLPPLPLSQPASQPQPLSHPSSHDLTLHSGYEAHTAPIDNTRKVALAVKSGDSLSSLFQRAGLSDRSMMNFLGKAQQAKRLESIKPKHTLEFYLDQDSNIQRLSYRSSKLKSIHYTLEDDAYTFNEEIRQPDIRRASRSGVITSSLYKAGKASRMDDQLILQLAEIFGWDIDFALDIREGDSFRVLFEEHFLDGEKLKNGAILSAEFINQKETFQAVRYVHEDGRVEYYTPEGKNMRKAFLRAPLDFRRISSNFNPRRLHPITKTVKPHRGIDYAARPGTPIWSSGDGKVIKASYDKYSGNHVVIQHGNNIQTKYLHLKKRYVKRGDKIRQKQVIGTLGATGRVTGPHLHYEFLLNGVHRNPRTIVQKLPKAESISSALKTAFLAQTKPLLAELMQETGGALIARQDTGDTASGNTQ